MGPKRALLLERIGVRTVEDALWLMPWRYEDRSEITPIGLVQPKTRVTICGKVCQVQVTRTSRRGMTIVEVVMEDESGRITCIYFNQPYLEEVIKVGMQLLMHGMVSERKRPGQPWQLDSPQYEILGGTDETPLHVGRIVPVYHETKGLTSRQLRTIINGLLDAYLVEVEEVLSPALLDRQGLPSLQEAIPEVHFPSLHTDPEVLERGRTPAHQRMAFEELYLLELALALRQRTVKAAQKGVTFDTSTPLRRRLTESLPFQLTSAQRARARGTHRGYEWGCSHESVSAGRRGLWKDGGGPVCHRHGLWIRISGGDDGANRDIG